MTDRTAPLAGGVVGVQVNVPLAATIVGLGVHATGLPELSLMLIVLPGVPVPLTELPLDGLTVGADAGGLTTTGVVLPAGSRTVPGPLIGVPGVFGVQVTIPLAVAGLGVHVAPGIDTVSPGVVPVHVTLPLGAVVHTGAVGGIWSTTIVDGPDTLPCGSV